MKVAKVLGTVVATEKHPDFDSLKLLIVQPLNERMEPEGNSFIATDRVQAGVGDTVLVMREGGGIRMLFGRAPKFAIRSLIVGIVDQVSVNE